MTRETLRKYVGMPLMFALAFLIGFNIVGCAAPIIDPDIAPYVRQFEVQYRTPASIDIGFANKTELPENVIGMCMWNVQSRKIRIDKAYWESVQPEDKLILIYHELGHCIFDRQHVVEVYKDGCPISLMMPTPPTSGCYDKHSIDMLDELVRFKGE